MAFKTIQDDYTLQSIFLGDLRSVLNLDLIPDESVNLICTSPPYGERRADTYGGIPVDAYVDWFLPLAEHFQRILVPDGSFVLNIKEGVIDYSRSLYVYDLVCALVRQQGWYCIDDYVWAKPSSAPGYWKRRFRDASEHCYHFTLSPEFKMRQQSVLVPASDAVRNLKKKDGPKESYREKLSSTGSGFTRDRNASAGKKWVLPDNVLRFSPESRNLKHPATFPETLPSWFIRLFTDEDDMVFDPFLGSGTTLVAAKRLLRNGVGVDRSLEYVKFAAERIANTAPEGEALIDPDEEEVHLPPIDEGAYMDEDL